MSTIKLTMTLETVLKDAATRPNGAIHPMPERLRGGAALKVINALVNKGLIQESGDGDWKISDEGYRAISMEPQKPAKEKTAMRTRSGTKQARLIEMMKRPGGATLDQLADAVHWQKHTIRGAISRALKKNLGLNVISERSLDGDRIYRISG